MEERVDQAMPYGYFQMWISTFHSFADQILRDNITHIGLNPDYTLLTKAQAILFLRNNLFSLKLKYFRPFGNPEKFLHSLIQHFSRLKDEYITPEEYLNWVKTIPKTTDISEEEAEKYLELAHAYKAYQEIKLKKGVFSFDDLIFYLLELFEQRPSILGHYKEQFKYILVDEFQDTNIAQYILVKNLAPPEDKPNLTVVGDDSQAIYKFRGASLSNILAFMQDYPTAKQTNLNKNYRSFQKILDLSHQLIKHNNPDTLEHRLGISKQLKASRKDKQGAVNFTFHEQVELEAEYVAKEIARLTEKKDYSFADFAILVRANNHADPFMTALYRMGIPYRFLGPGALFKQAEVKDLIAYLQVLYDINDSVSFYRVMSMDIFKIDPKDTAALVSFARKINLSLFEAANLYRQITENEELSTEEKNYQQYMPLFTIFSKQSINSIVQMVHRHLEMMKKHSAGEILYDFFEESGYLNMFISKKTEKNERIIKNISKFFNRLKGFEADKIDNSVNGVVEYINLSLDLGESPQAEEVDMVDYDAVNILTVHSSKGLEFPVVFLPNLTKGRFPTTQKKEKIPLPEDIVKEILPEGDHHVQEERRLFYVGLTRACDIAYLSASKFYTGGKRERKLSPFVVETLGEETVNNTLLLKEEEKEQLSIFDFKPVKDDPIIKEKKPKLHSFSYSQIETFQRCPLQYKYMYILKVPSPPSGALAFGETIHKALQSFYEQFRQDRSVNLNYLLKLYDELWIPVGYSSKKEHKEKLAAGKDMLTNYYKTFHHQDLNILGIERNFKIKLDEGIYLTGKIDRVDNKGNENIEIIDYKTGSKPDERKLKKNLQFGLYALAAIDKGLYGKDPVQITLTFYYLQDMEKISMKKSFKEILTVKEDVLKTIETIKQSDFLPKVGPWCDFCPFKMICDAW
jgi:DNA helicase-2/ATP-dependent DNA helicase PcrA